MTTLLSMLLLAACDNKSTITTVFPSSASVAVQLAVKQVLVPAGNSFVVATREDDLAMRQQYGFPALPFVDEHL
jgi:uncharacterized lipoprotein YajG